MTHTVVSTEVGSAGNQRTIDAEVLISSYTSGGEVLTDLTDMLSQIDNVMVMGIGSTPFYPLWDESNKKLKAHIPYSDGSTPIGSTPFTTGGYLGSVKLKLWGR